jgi:hypothetical protein
MLVANTLTDINIASPYEVFSYTWRNDPVSVLFNVVVGSQVDPIVGGGNYFVRVYLNGILLSPDPAIAVESGTQQTLFQSRPVILATNDVVSIFVQGLPADTGVDVSTEMLAPDVVTLVGASSFSTDGSVNVLEQIRLNIIAKLNDLTYYKPSYSINGQSVQSTEYRMGLQEELAMVETRIRRANSDSVPGRLAHYRNHYRRDYGGSPFVPGGQSGGGY